MPKSKRPKIVHTSKVSKDRRALSERLYNNVKEAATSYPYVFVFEVDNMRNRYLKEVRTEFADSRYAPPSRTRQPKDNTEEYRGMQRITEKGTAIGLNTRHAGCSWAERS